MITTRWLLAFTAVSQVALAALDDPAQAFIRPPESAKPGVWWHWMGCNVTQAGITRDLETFKQAGIGGATIFGMADVCSPWAAHIENSPTDGLIALTDPWWEMVSLSTPRSVFFIRALLPVAVAPTTPHRLKNRMNIVKCCLLLTSKPPKQQYNSLLICKIGET